MVRSLSERNGQAETVEVRSQSRYTTSRYQKSRRFFLVGTASGNGFSKVADDEGAGIEAKSETKLSTVDSDDNREN